MAKDTRKEATKHYAGADGVYITVPELDPLGNKHANLGINGVIFESGTHYVHKDIAGEMERILKAHHAQTMQLLYNKPAAAIAALVESLGSRYASS